MPAPCALGVPQGADRDPCPFLRDLDSGRRGALACKVSLLDLAFWELVRVRREYGFGRQWRGAARWLAATLWRAWRAW